MHSLRQSLLLRGRTLNWFAHGRVILGLLLLLSGISLLLHRCTRTARAATLTVNKAADTNDGVCDADCSLREAIAAANSGDTIVFSSLFNTSQTITLGGSELAVNKNLTITGPGANLLTVSGNNASRVFNISSVTVNISGLTINSGASGAGGGIFSSGGSLSINGCAIANNQSNFGGGIFNTGGSTLNLTNSTISGNASPDGGGIFNNAGGGLNVVNVTNCTISGNMANAGGSGGAGIEARDTVNVTNSTISGNTTNATGGGILNTGVTVNLKNNIISGNTAPANANGPDLAGTFTTQGYNLIGKNDDSNGLPAGNPNVNNDIVGTSASPIDAMLTPLGSYGGPTQTQIPLFGSPAIDKGAAANDPNTGNPITSDQRGLTRPFDNPSIPPASGGNNSDIGAVELQYSPTAANGSISGTVTDALGLPIAGVTINLNGSESRVTITDSAGTYHLDSIETNGFYTVTPSRADFAFSPMSRSFSLLGGHTESSFTAIPNGDDANPIDSTGFFVRQQYIDFLGREPDPPGFAGWISTINNCLGDTTQCDRIHVSQLFFQSQEFQERGYFVYRFYPVAFGRKPDYGEFVPDLVSVSGFLDANQLEAAKVAFIAAFMVRPAFANTYNPLTNQQYVDMLLNTADAGIGASARQAMMDGLNNSTLTRAQVLRQIVESSEVSTKYNHQAYVVMEYFGYLRRQPNSFYLQWIAVLDATNDPRGMVTGFVNSQEYRNRFGP